LGRSPSAIKQKAHSLGLKKKLGWVNQLTLEQRAYIAGILDAEGTISVKEHRKKDDWHRGRCYLEPVLAVYNTDIRLLEWLKKTTACGLISPHWQLKKGLGNRKPCYVWKTNAEYAFKGIVEQVKEFLLLKRTQADLVLALFSGKGEPQDVLREVRILNRRGGV